MALNDTRLRNLKPKAGKTERLVADGNGLYIRIRAGEGGLTRTWQFRRREGGKQTVTTLGTYPELPLLEARQQALELATKGKSYSPTVEIAAEQWLSERIDHTHRKAELIRGYVERAVIPALGSRRVRDIEPSDIAITVRDYRDRTGKKAAAHKGGRTAARALLGVFKGLFGYAVANGWIKLSPAAQLTAAVVGPPGAARTRVLSDDEIGFVMTTGIGCASARPTTAIERASIGWSRPSSRRTSASIAFGSRIWLWPSSTGIPGRPPDLMCSTGWPTIPADGAHTTCGGPSALGTTPMGVPPYIVERMLNHIFDGVMAVYNHATYDAERRQALEAWSAWLASFIGKRPADVVPLRQVSPQAA